MRRGVAEDLATRRPRGHQGALPAQRLRGEGHACAAHKESTGVTAADRPGPSAGVIARMSEPLLTVSGYKRKGQESRGPVPLVNLEAHSWVDHQGRCLSFRFQIAECLVSLSCCVPRSPPPESIPSAQARFSGCGMRQGPRAS
jgi:hypothetical protein